MSSLVARRRRRRLAPEVVQTSSMDCGPATLKCLLEGHGISVSYGRLREACQTDIDGTSIDTLEAVASQLGLSAEQISIPLDHLLLASAEALPAIVVTRQRDGALHFVVIWCRYGPWLQVMDPSIGRCWVKARVFMDEVYRHEQSVSAEAWRTWAASEDHLAPLRSRLQSLGVGLDGANSLIAAGQADTNWFGLATLDAGIRLVQVILSARGIGRGKAAERLLRALIERTMATTSGARSGDEVLDIYEAIPPHYWSVAPDPATSDPEEPMLLLRGAVLVRVVGAHHAGKTMPSEAAPLSPELTAAISERTQHPLGTVYRVLRTDGLLAPLALLGAIALAAGAILIETLLFRGLFDLAALLTQPMQRLLAVAALVGFAAVLLLIQVPIMVETARMGRHLEMRLRMALLSKLPRLRDKYFNSRPVSDMAERSHSIQTTRALPALGLQFVQVLCEMVFTLTGIALIDARSFGGACIVAVLAVCISAGAQPIANERDLRVRNHAGALYGFYLDALLGLVPIRTHCAGRAVQRLHEGLLVEWARSCARLIRFSLGTSALQSFVCTGIAAWLLVDHFLRSGGVSGTDLLLVYWVLRLPAIGKAISALALAYPAQRNALLRLMEPLSAPEEEVAARSHRAATACADTSSASRIEIVQGRVVAGGHVVLDQVNLDIAPGEHVAIVGRSGAGKSTLLGLLLGWHRAAAGELRIDGRPLDGPALEALRRHTAWIDPAIQIWNRTFADNVAYASSTDGLHRVGHVIEAARLRELLQKLPQGLQHILGEGGGLLSGGEGQRVRLARALMQEDVRLALLDEPFRGMDRRQRTELLEELRRWWPAATLLCVTHDVGETQQFPRVLVIEDGRVVEDDAPGALLEHDSRYRQLLDAERTVRDRMWQGRQWRRLRLTDRGIESVGP